jgi:hypothetical protein
MNQFAHNFLRRLATGAAFLAGSVVLQFFFVGVSLLISFVEMSDHAHQPGYRPNSLLTSGRFFEFVTFSIFFFTAFLVGLFPKSFKPISSVAVAYLVHFGINLLLMNRIKAQTSMLGNL